VEAEKSDKGAMTGVHQTVKIWTKLRGLASETRRTTLAARINVRTRGREMPQKKNPRERTRSSNSEEGNWWLGGDRMKGQGNRKAGGDGRGGDEGDFAGRNRFSRLHPHCTNSGGQSGLTRLMMLRVMPRAKIQARVQGLLKKSAALHVSANELDRVWKEDIRSLRYNHLGVPIRAKRNEKGEEIWKIRRGRLLLLHGIATRPRAAMDQVGKGGQRRKSSSSSRRLAVIEGGKAQKKKIRGKEGKTLKHLHRIGKEFCRENLHPQRGPNLKKIGAKTGGLEVDHAHKALLKRMGPHGKEKGKAKREGLRAIQSHVGRGRGNKSERITKPLAVHR